MNKKSNQYKHLTEGEMLKIYEIRRSGKSIQEIAKWVRRSKSTVWQCLNYSPKDESVKVLWFRFSSIQKAEYQYRGRLKEPRPRIKKLVKDKELRKFVIRKLTEGAFSPEDVSYLAGIELGRTVCFKTIYAYIKKENTDLKKYLLEEGKPRRQRDRRGKFKQAATAMRPIALSRYPKSQNSVTLKQISFR